jgi:signal transduction histidine kinase
MPSQYPPRNPTFWFIPGMLVCVSVLSGLCLFFIHRQVNSEQERLRELERFSLEQTQQLFRHDLESKWQEALRLFPNGLPEYPSMRAWDLQLGEDILGFCLDNSGLLLYPSYQFYSMQDLSTGGHRRPPRRSSPERGFEFPAPSARSGLESSFGSSREDSYRQLLAAVARKDRETALRLCASLLSHGLGAFVADGLPAGPPAIAVALELGEASPSDVERQANFVDFLLRSYEGGSVPLTPGSLSWLARIQEQCRRRNDQEAWLRRESQASRLVRQTQFAEKFLARMNLLLRRNLYNVARADLPVQYLTSDPSEEPLLVVCKFLERPPLGLLGLAIHLDGFCSKLEDSLAKASWLPPEVKVRIRREGLNLTSEKLMDQRILDPRAPQFLVQAQPRDSLAFERRALQKNLLYLATVLVSACCCILVLFFGNRALKEQERLSKLRTDFLTNVSHELKTPLTAIRLHGETLERLLSDGSSSAAASVQTIVGEADRLTLLISDVLEFTRIENDKKRFFWEMVDLVTVVRESVQLFSHQLDEAGFKLSLEMPESLMLQQADRAALKQTAVNLISNSLKFSADQKRLKIRLARNGRKVIWEFEDLGAGIDPQDLPFIFEKFYRAPRLDPAISGTGLGLTLCKAFVEAHGGKIHVESTPGQGSRFVIHLPVGMEQGAGKLEDELK